MINASHVSTCFNHSLGLWSLLSNLFWRPQGIRRYFVTVKSTDALYAATAKMFDRTLADPMGRWVAELILVMEIWMKWQQWPGNAPRLFRFWQCFLAEMLRKKSWNFTDFHSFVHVVWLLVNGKGLMHTILIHSKTTIRRKPTNTDKTTLPSNLNH